MTTLAREDRATVAEGSGFSAKLRRNGAGYLFLAPWLIGFFGFTIGPVLVSLYLSFTNFDLLRPPQWIGADNYVRMFTGDYRFFQALDAGDVHLRAVRGAAEAGVRLAVASCWTRQYAAAASTGRCLYLPSLLGGSVAIAVLWRRCSPATAASTSRLALFGIQGPSWISNPDYVALHPGRALASGSSARR